MNFTINRLKSLQPGESFIYFVGYLDGERLINPLGTSALVAVAAQNLAEEGRIHLTQRRLSLPKTREGHIDWKAGKGSGFEYIATGAIPKPKNHREFLNEKGRPDPAREQSHGRSRPAPQTWRL